MVTKVAYLSQFLHPSKRFHIPIPLNFSTEHKLRPQESHSAWSLSLFISLFGPLRISRAPFCLLKTIQKGKTPALGLLARPKQNASRADMGTPLGKLHSLTPLSGEGAIRSISLRWNAGGTRAYYLIVVDLSKRTQPSRTCRLHVLSPSVLKSLAPSWGTVGRGSSEVPRALPC